MDKLIFPTCLDTCIDYNRSVKDNPEQFCKDHCQYRSFSLVGQHGLKKVNKAVYLNVKLDRLQSELYYTSNGSKTEHHSQILEACLETVNSSSAIGKKMTEEINQSLQQSGKGNAVNMKAQDKCKVIADMRVQQMHSQETHEALQQEILLLKDIQDQDPLFSRDLNAIFL